MRFSSALVIATMVFCADASENLPSVQKIFLPPRLHLGNTGILPVQPIDSAAWIWQPSSSAGPPPAHADIFAGGWREPVLLRFRRQFEAAASPIRIHVSADERFELFLDGNRIARGSDRYDVEHWAYATYDLRLNPADCRKLSAAPRFRTAASHSISPLPMVIATGAWNCQRPSPACLSGMAGNKS